MANKKFEWDDDEMGEALKNAKPAAEEKKPQPKRKQPKGK